MKEDLKMESKETKIQIKKKENGVKKKGKERKELTELRMRKRESE